MEKMRDFLDITETETMKQLTSTCIVVNDHIVGIAFWRSCQREQGEEHDLEIIHLAVLGNMNPALIIRSLTKELIAQVHMLNEGKLIICTFQVNGSINDEGLLKDELKMDKINTDLTSLSASTRQK